MAYSDLRKIAFIGDYPPRKCGIATFTHDLRSAVAQHAQSECIVVPVDDMADGYEYPPEVRFQIAEQDLDSYRRAADFLNFSDVDVVSLQHEFGIYGGTCRRTYPGFHARLAPTGRDHASHSIT